MQTQSNQVVDFRYSAWFSPVVSLSDLRALLNGDTKNVQCNPQTQTHEQSTDTDKTSETSGLSAESSPTQKKSEPCWLSVRKTERIQKRRPKHRAAISLVHPGLVARPSLSDHENHEQKVTPTTTAPTSTSTSTPTLPSPATITNSESPRTPNAKENQSITLKYAGRKYVCDVEGCGKAFKDKHGLMCHERTHTGERPYECLEPGCGLRFTETGALSRHMKSLHSTERPHACELCTKAFKLPHHLKRHYHLCHDRR